MINSHYLVNRKVRNSLLACVLTLFAVESAAGDELDAIVQLCIVTSDETACEATKQSFREWWPAANAGDYGAQRNVAFCFSTGCDGAIGVDVERGCAWRMVIAASDSPEVGSGDMANLENDCGRLGRKGQANASAQAKRLYRQIYGRQMPAL